MSSPPATLEEYLQRLPPPARRTLEQLRRRILELSPQGTTEGISYGVPAFFFHGRLLGFAAFPKHYTLLPFHGTVLAQFAEDLVPWKHGKGSIQFPYTMLPPDDFLRRLIAARIIGNQQTAPSSGKTARTKSRPARTEK